VRGRSIASISRCPGLSPFWASSSGVWWCPGSRRLGSAPWASSRRTLAEPALQGEPAQRPAGDVARDGLLQAADLGSGGDQDVHDVGHAEHRGVLQRGAAGHAAVGRGDRFDVGPGVDQHLGDLGVGSELVLAPVLHLGGGQLGVLGQQAGQPGQVAAVEDVAAFDFELELGPAGAGGDLPQRFIPRPCSASIQVRTSTPSATQHLGLTPSGAFSAT
jgi:hypothetical protein